MSRSGEGGGGVVLESRVPLSSEGPAIQGQERNSFREREREAKRGREVDVTLSSVALW